MEQSTLMLIILAVATVMFLCRKIPIFFTCIVAMLATYFSGVLTVNEAFNGFSSSAVWSLVGMSMATGAFKASGLADLVGIKLFSLTGGNQKYVSIGVYLIAAALTFITPGMTVVLLLMPMVDALVSQSNGTLSRKMTYMPLGIGALLGGNLTLSGSANLLQTSGMLEGVTGETFSYFTPFPIAIATVVFGLVYLLTFGPKIMKKVFKPEEEAALAVDAAAVNAFQERGAKVTNKMKITAVILLAMLALLIWNKWSMPVVAFSAVSLLVVTGCVKPDEAVSNVPWTLTLQIIAMLGLAKGISVSGAGDVLGNLVLGAGTKLGLGAFGILVMYMLMCQILSNFLSSKVACVGILVPIALSMAQALGTNALAYALATVIAVNASFLTPICCPLIAFTWSAGYKFTDYFRANILLNVFTFVGSVIAVKLVYFM